ncbi:MAG: TlyA family RNA methyltransferase [Oscillospiraceae bacterium]|nr:TlyA family RNA methyltransferase [Oscillospiraceae bacterium]
MRADAAMVARGLCKSRTRAKALIEEGKVYCGERPVAKPAEDIAETATLTLRGDDLRYVGRGGLKLEGALGAFPVSPDGRVCMDIGASTGGFTDCMLQNGAALVYAVDVGHDQLDARLREDPRVVDLEGTDIRRMPPPAQTPTFCSIDVSFISLRLVLPAAFALLADEADCIALIKPQFEAGRAALGKHGIVRSAKAHVQVLEELLTFAQEIGFAVQGVCVSPVRGGSGNIEYLTYLTKGRADAPLLPDIRALVRTTGLVG